MSGSVPDRRPGQAAPHDRPRDGRARSTSRPSANGPPARRARARRWRPPSQDAAAERLVAVAKALADPVRLRLVDVLRDHPGKLCPCELAPLFELSQPTISHHLKVLKDAGILDAEKHGLFVYYYVRPGALDELTTWLRR